MSACYRVQGIDLMSLGLKHYNSVLPPDYMPYPVEKSPNLLPHNSKNLQINYNISSGPIVAANREIKNKYVEVDTKNGIMLLLLLLLL